MNTTIYLSVVDLIELEINVLNGEKGHHQISSQQNLFVTPSHISSFCQPETCVKGV